MNNGDLCARMTGLMYQKPIGKAFAQFAAAARGVRWKNFGAERCASICVSGIRHSHGLYPLRSLVVR